MGTRIVYDAKTGQTRTESFTPPSIPLSKRKSQVIDDLKVATQEYILRQYPDIKQKSDVADKEYFGTLLLAQNQAYTADFIYKAAFEKAKMINDGIGSLSEAVSSFPLSEQAMWEQLIKVAVRVGFVMRCKAVFREAVGRVDSAQNEAELSSAYEWFITELNKIQLGGDFR